MAYVSTNFNMLEDTIGGSAKRWSYQTTDSLSTFTAVGYIADAAKKGISKGDVVEVVNRSVPSLFYCQVASVIAGVGTLQVAAGGFNSVTLNGAMRTMVPNSQGSGAASANVTTYSGLLALETDYTMVRLIYSSQDAGGYAIPLVKISPTGAVGDSMNPTDGTGSSNQTLWKTVTWNNGGADTLPQDQTVFGSGTSTFTVPGNAGNLSQPPRYYSDWIRIQSIPRTDGGTLPLLLIRALTDAAGTFRGGNVPQAHWNAFAGTRIINVFFTFNDRVTDPTAVAMTGATSGTMPCLGVQYFSAVPGFSVLLTGDSWTEGVGSTTGFHSWGVLACQALSTPQRPISWWNHGWSGQISADFWANGYTAFKACQPDIVTIPAWSPNDGGLGATQAIVDAEWSRCMDFASYVKKNGATPVLFPPFPWTPITTAAQDAVRLQNRTRMLNAAATGMFFAMDFEALIGTGASPNRLAPGMESTLVAQHPSDLAYSTIDQQVFRPILQNLIGR